MSEGEEEVLRELRRIAAVELGWERTIEPEQLLVADLQLDSISLLTVVTSLENRFRIILGEEDEGAIHTVEELVRLVARRRTEASP